MFGGSKDIIYRGYCMFLQEKIIWIGESVVIQNLRYYFNRNAFLVQRPQNNLQQPSVHVRKAADSQKVPSVLVRKLVDDKKVLSVPVQRLVDDEKVPSVLVQRLADGEKVPSVLLQNPMYKGKLTFEKDGIKIL